MSLLQEIFPLLIPIFVIDVILAVAAVRHILRHPHYRFGNQGYVACNLSGYPYVWPDYLFCFWER